MTPLAFQAKYAALWQRLETALERAEAGTAAHAADKRRGAEAASLARLYRTACEHLALAQARGYPLALTQRLEQLTYRAHRLIYRRQDLGGTALRQLLLVDIPQSVRAQRHYLALAALLFVLPALAVGWATWRDSTFALHVLDVRSLDKLRSMYEDGDHALGRARTAGDDWTMFGYYIRNNISIGFQCFAGGLFAGLGSAWFLVYNGLFMGAAAGYVSQLGLASNFFSFVVTHSAFELTAICLSGAAGLRIGHAVIAPGRRGRLDALRRATSEAVVLVYAVFAMLLLAAALEAFWSSARWIAPAMKFAAGAAAWALVGAYLTWQGRPGRGTPPAAPSGPHAG